MGFVIIYAGLGCSPEVAADSSMENVVPGGSEAQKNVSVPRKDEEGCHQVGVGDSTNPSVRNQKQNSGEIIVFSEVCQNSVVMPPSWLSKQDVVTFWGIAIESLGKICYV